MLDGSMDVQPLKHPEVVRRPKLVIIYNVVVHYSNSKSTIKSSGDVFRHSQQIG